MNINFGTFLTQCAAMGVWIFMCAGLFAIVERFLNAYFPGFLALEEAGASQSGQPVKVVDTAKPS